MPVNPGLKGGGDFLIAFVDLKRDIEKSKRENFENNDE